MLLVQPGSDGTLACVARLACGLGQRRAVLLGLASSRTFLLPAGEAPESWSACSISSCRITLSILFHIPLALLSCARQSSPMLAGSPADAEELSASHVPVPVNACRLAGLLEGSCQAGKDTPDCLLFSHAYP